MGEEYDVFSIGRMPEFPEKYADIRGRVKTLFILPSVTSDIKIEIFSFSAKNIFSYIPAALSAAKFLQVVRGLPLSEITVETPLGELLIWFGDDGKCAAFLNRFTVLEEHKIHIVEEEIKTFTLNTPFGKIRALKVNSAIDFSEAILRESALSREGEDIIGAAVYDEKGNAACHFSKSGEYPKALTAAITVASALKKTAQSLKIGDDIFDFLYLDGKFKVSDRARAPLTFYAPEII